MAAFIGRATEHDRLVNLIAAATSPERVDIADAAPHVLLVSGDAGIGKTRLVDEAVSSLASPTLVVACGAAFESDESVPLVPVAALVRDLLRQLPEAEVDELVAPVRSTLSRLLPELGPVGAGDEARPADVLPWLLTRISAGRSLVLVVDDVQWADTSTIDVLERLPRQARGAIALVVITRAESALSARVSRALADLARRPNAAEVALAPLADADSDALVRSIVDGILDPAVRRRIVARAQGNPLFTEALAAAAAQGADQPTRLMEALLAPLRTLDEPARALVRAAAVWGAPARPEALAGLARLVEPAPGSPDPWRSAREAGVLVDVGDRVDVRHPLLRQAVLDDLTIPERQRLREDAVTLLRQQVDDGGSLRSGPALAGLLESLGRVDEAAVAFVRAAETTVGVSYAETVAMESRALELWTDEVGRELGLSRAELLERAAGHAGSAGDATTAVAWVREALSLWSEEPDSDPLQGSRLSALLATCGEWELDEAEVLTAYEEAIRLAEPHGASEALARALTGLARHRMSLDQNQLALELATRARTAAVAAGARDEESYALGVVGGAFAQLGQVAEARAALTEALAVLDPASPSFDRRRAWIDLRRGYLEWLAGNGGPAAVTLIELAAGYGGQDVASAYPALARATAAEFFVWSGEYARAAEVITQVREELDTGAFDRSLVESTVVMAECELAIRSGRLTEAAAGLEANLAHWDELGLREFDFHDLVRLAEVRGLQGDPATARSLLDEVTPGAFASDSAEEVTGLVRTGVLVEGAVARAGGRPDLDRVRSLLARLDELDAAGGCGERGIPSADAATARAEAARLLEHDDPHAWEVAVDAWDSAGVPWWAAWCRVRLAESLVATRGARDDAAGVLAQALESAGSLGAVPVLDLAADLVRRAGLPAGAASPGVPHPRSEADPVAPDSVATTGSGTSAYDEERWAMLTRREREVVDQIAAGLSNRAIAAALFISEKTVSVHVSNVLAKWELRSRLEIAAVAHRSSTHPA